MALLLYSVWLLLEFSVVLNPVFAAAYSDQELTCSQGLCVPRDSLCDFTDDCGDGRDEENCEFKHLNLTAVKENLRVRLIYRWLLLHELVNVLLVILRNYITSL